MNILFSKSFFFETNNKKSMTTKKEFSLAPIFFFLVFVAVSVTCVIVFSQNTTTQAAITQNSQEYSQLSLLVQNVVHKKSNSNTLIPVLVIGRSLFSSLLNFQISNTKPLLQLAQLSFELKKGFESKVSNAYKHKNKYHVVTYDDQLNKYLLKFIKLIAEKNAHLVSPSCEINTEHVISQHTVFPTNDSFSDSKSIQLSETWQVREINSKKEVLCTSQLIYDTMYEYCNLSESTTIFYVTSQEREDEVREAYQNDTTFNVKNTTSCIHSCVLKSMFPKIKIVIVQKLDNSQDQPKDEYFEKACEFMELYF